MSDVKVKSPTEKQLQVLGQLTRGRMVAISSVTTGDKVKRSASLQTASGKPVADSLRMDPRAVESCASNGWLKLHGEQSNDGAVTQLYEITDEGQKARRRK